MGKNGFSLIPISILLGFSFSNLAIAKDTNYIYKCGLGNQKSYRLPPLRLCCIDQVVRVIPYVCFRPRK
jgi:hypothetical protein